MHMFLKPSFAKNIDEDQSFISLKQKVSEQLVLTEVKSPNQYKAIVLPLLYFASWSLALYFRLTPPLYYFFYGLLGFFAILIFVNLIHDACHSTLFKEKWKNKAVYSLFDIIGANSYIWRIRHIRMHHNYPNAVGMDSDIDQGGPLKVFPSVETKPIHKYQYLWFFVLYPFFLLNWLLIRDFNDFYNPKRDVRKFSNIPTIQYYKLWFFKLLFFSYIIFIPIFVYKIEVSQVLSGFLIQMIVGSLFGLIILLPPHANVGNDFPVPDENHKLSTSWIRHQFNTTNDIKESNFITKHLMSNFNYHLAHHLFPNISSAHADEVTKIIKEFAVNNDFPYKSYPLITTLKMHYKLLKNNVVEPFHLFEETM